MRISDWSSDVCSSDLVASACAMNTSSRQVMRVSTCSAGVVHTSEQRFTSSPLGSSAIGPSGVNRSYAQPRCGRRVRTAVTIADRSEEHTSELQSLMRLSYAVFCLKKKNSIINHTHTHNNTH